jgi:hypothetical protein
MRGPKEFDVSRLASLRLRLPRAGHVQCYQFSKNPGQKVKGLLDNWIYTMLPGGPYQLACIDRMTTRRYCLDCFAKDRGTFPGDILHMHEEVSCAGSPCSEYWLRI